MKRDWELVRTILQTIEAGEHGYAPFPFKVPGHADEAVGYHVYLMHDAGLVEAIESGDAGSPSPCWSPRRLTWAGHDFLEAARKDTLWNQAMAKAKEHAPALTLDAFKALLGKAAKEFAAII